MAGRLRVQEFMILAASGVPVFHYSWSNTQKLDELLSGFLSAITSFASEFGERSVQSLSFEGSEILYEQTEQELLFLFLVGTGAPHKTLRIVLRDLSRRFLGRYSPKTDDIVIDGAFDPFKKDVREAFDYYEGVLIVTSTLSAYVVPRINQDALERAMESGGFLDEFHRDFGGEGTRVLEAIDGKTSIDKLSLRMGLEDEEVSEVIEYLTIWGILSILQMCPQFSQDDARFDAFLDVIGLPSKDYQLLQRAKQFCNGTRSVVEISERLGVTPDQLYEMLEKLGDEVKWILVEVSGLSRTLRPRY